MKERPILFSGPMVSAILSGTKTQTRRVAKGVHIVHERTSEALAQLDSAGPRISCPYGQPGDRLWVRETWAPQVDCELSAARWTTLGVQNGPKPLTHFAAGATERPWISKWRPSIHMPRWASRITLEITGVRVERLQAISEADAIAEGVERQDGAWWKSYIADKDRDAYTHLKEARASFSSLWVSINGDGSWDANPWVWVVEFKRLPIPSQEVR